MLRWVLLVLYLIASSSHLTADYGGGFDPNGASLTPPPAPTADYGAGYDPNGGK